MTPKEFLQQIRSADRLIDSKLKQLECLRDETTRTSSMISDMPRSDSPNLQRMESTIVKLLDLEAEINADIDQLVDMKRVARDAINALSNADQRLVLELRYLCYKTWPWIADELGYSISNVYRLHDNALKNIRLPESL
jgi:DNA-directed RNA polymerase specialized sigma subunit